MTYKLATMLLALGTQACVTHVPLAVECPAYPTPPQALAPAPESLSSPTPLLDSWQRSRAELLQFLKPGTER